MAAGPKVPLGQAERPSRAPALAEPDGAAHTRPGLLGTESGGAMSFNLAVILSETAQSSPDQPVAVFGGGQLTYRQLDQASDRVAATLATAGIRPGDPVALQLPNIPQFLVSYFGILKAGGVVVPLNVMLQAPEVAFHLSDSGARILITWEGVLAEAAKGAEAAGLGQVYAVGHANDSGAGDPAEPSPSNDCWTPRRRTLEWRRGSRWTRPSSSIRQGPRDGPRGPSSRTSSCT